VTGGEARKKKDNRPQLLRRPHRRMGRRPGPPKGSANAWKTGLNSAAMVEHRKAFNVLMRAARRAIRELR
jgi:hypothetical protein